MSTDLGQRIREARERAGLTQQQVGARVGVSLRTVGNWERGETVPMNRMARLEQVLNTQLRQRTRPASETPAADSEPETVGPDPQDAERQLPVGAGVDPELLVELAQADPAAIEAVRAVLRAARRGD